MIRLAALIALAVMLCACREQEQAPAARAAGPDVVLHRETETIDDTVPERATLDSLLRQNQLSADLVQAAIESAANVFNPRLLRANRHLSARAIARRPAARVRYQIDADRFSPHRVPRRGQPAVLDAAVAPVREGDRTIASVRGRLTPTPVAHLADGGDR